MQSNKIKPLTLPKRRSAQAGMTILEYAMVGVGVLSLSLLAIIASGSNLNDLFDLLKTDFKSQIQVGKNTADAHLTAQSSFQPKAPTQPASKSSDTGGGPNQETSAGSSIGLTQTAGANGATSAYSQDILQQAQQALAKGDISHSEYNMVIALANKGHDIAVMQGMLETASQNSNGNASRFANATLYMNGQNYSPSQINAQLQNNINTFTSMQKAAESQAGVTRSIALLSVLQESGGQIIINAGNTAQNTESAGRAVYTDMMDKSAGRDASNTHQQSGNICAGGKGTDSGAHCN